MVKSQDFLKEIQKALDDQSYDCVHSLLKKWRERDSKNPWFHYYVAHWYEITEKYDEAERRYRKLLQVSTGAPKVMALSRQGIERLEIKAKEIEAEAIAAERAAEGGEDNGLFIIEPIAPAEKKEAAQHFATVMDTDPYSASLQLPTKSWRLFRTGKLGELRFYAKALREGGIPGFCLSLDQLRAVQVFQVQHVVALEPELVVQCLDVAQNEVKLTLEWSEINQYVEGLIPLFEESLEKDSRGKSYYKTKVLDYAQFWDFHAGDRQAILRFNDQHYQFREGFSFFPEAEDKNQLEQQSLRHNWNHLKAKLLEFVDHAQSWSDFKSFAAHASDFPELLRKIDPQVNLFRQEEHQNTHWDPAWQLYSAIAFVKTAGSIEDEF